MNIDSPVTNIIIAGDHQLRILGFYMVKVLAEFIKEAVFKSLPIFPTRAGWEINAHHRNVVKVNPYVAALAIILADPAAIFHFFWRMLGEDGGAAISFFFGRVPVMFVTYLFEQQQIGYYIGRSLNFLQTNYILVGGLHP